MTINVTPVNDAPNVLNVMLNSTDLLNRTNGSLIVGWNFFDIDGDLQQNNQTIWYINGTEKIEFRNFTFINSTNLTKTQNWTFSVRAFDGTIFSEFANSSSLLIQNSPPTQSIPMITSNDDQSRKNGTLTCSNQSTNDLDNDAVTNLIKWYNNSVLINESVNSINLSAGNFSKNANVTCEIIPFDGSVNGTPLNSSNFTILNGAPLLNNSIPDKSWNKDTSTTINLVNGFVDIDGDNLTYNYTDASNIVISVNNNTGTATLTPSTDGTRYIVFFAFDSTNITRSNNITLTVNNPPAPSSGGGSSSSSSGGGGSGNFICEFDWRCGEWSECLSGKQERKCILVQVPVFTLNDKCPQNTIPEQSRDCKVPVAVKETCGDKIRNQNEKDVDCGGVCKPCKTEEPKKKRVSGIIQFDYRSCCGRPKRI